MTSIPPQSRPLAAELGCSVVETPVETAKGSNTVITVVTDDTAMQRIFSESDPESLLPFSEGRLFLNCATASPGTHMEIERRVRKRKD